MIHLLSCTSTAVRSSVYIYYCASIFIYNFSFAITVVKEFRTSLAMQGKVLARSPRSNQVVGYLAIREENVNANIYVN